LSRHEKTLRAVLSGAADAAIDFDQLRALLRHLGFAERIRGSHHIFTHPRAGEILNVQPRGRHAKPYQVRQVRGVLRRYHGGDAAHAD
jgi:HicA-like toxin of HicAB toxin-antitoxin system